MRCEESVGWTVWVSGRGAYLERDVPSTPGEAKDHACREEDAPYSGLEEDVEP